jgi:hypothetical protein
VHILPRQFHFVNINHSKGVIVQYLFDADGEKLNQMINIFGQACEMHGEKMGLVKRTMILKRFIDLAKAKGLLREVEPPVELPLNCPHSKPVERDGVWRRLREDRKKREADRK